MKKLIRATFVVALFGIFTVFATPYTDKEKCHTDCCQTELCRTHCIESGCCIKDKTCDITNHKECKHKCCSTEKKSCDPKEKKSCCKIE